MSRAILQVLALVLLLIRPAAADAYRDLTHVVVADSEIAFGETVEVVGVCQPRDFFESGEASIEGLRFNGKANQERITFQLRAARATMQPKLSSLKRGDYCKVRGSLTDARGSGSQKTCMLLVERFEPISPSPLVFADFANRRATFEGIAAAGGILKLGDETARLDGAAWSLDVEGKKVSVSGAVRRDGDNWMILRPTWQLVELADQLGAKVTLEGTLWSSNGHWWFEYRGERLYLITERGPRMTFEGENHGRAARVTGELVRQLRPSLRQITEKSDRDLVATFVVRGARVEFPEQQFDWSDRFGWLYATYFKLSDGVPELLAESGFRRNLMGDETRARLFAERNYKALHAILQNWTPKTAQVITRRMADEKLPEPLRLLYAALLARANDIRGKRYLLQSVESRRPNSILDALYCFGAFPRIAPDVKEIAPQVEWAEKALISVMLDQSVMKAEADVLRPSKTTISMVDAAVIYSEIPAVLMEINTPAARSALISYAVANPKRSRDVVAEMCRSKTELPADELLQLEAAARDEYARREILIQLLRQKHHAAGERFYKYVEEYYYEFRDHPCPEALAAIRSHLGELQGDALEHAKMLLGLNEEDPVAALLTMLEERRRNDKTLVLHELARLADSRAVGPVARLLSEAPKDFLNVDSELSATIAVEHALDAVARPGTKESLAALVDLLEVDLSRFGAYIDRAGLQRIVAAHLIELTGESFGVNAEAWRNWLQTRPAE